MKKRKILIIIFILLIFIGMYVKRERNLGELLDISKEDIWQCTVEEIYCNGTQWEYKSAVIENAEETDSILKMLNETTVSFGRWTWNSDMREGKYCYELLIFDKSKHWIRFMENEEIHVLNGGHWVFAVEEEDMRRCTDILKEILQKYEIES